MLEQMAIGAAIYGAFGFVLGICIAVFSRDGIWPEVFLGIIVLLAIVGAGVGLVDFMITAEVSQ